MTNADLHTLTGAYVLHALAPEERAEFERHLGMCPACTQEVRELAATVGKLGLAVAVTPPPALKQQVLRRISAERQDPPRIARQGRGGAHRGRKMSRFALAACVAAAAAFGGVSVWQHQEAQDARQEAQRAQQHAEELASVLAAPDARVSSAKLSDGARGTVVVSHSRNKAAFLTSGLPKPPEGRVYQLWFADAGKMRSAGLMDPDATDNAVLMEGPLNAASGMGVTVEPAGGSAQPTTAPLALVKFPA
ncbi:anti-sigma factor domain-containing protein [Streptomyces sp. NBC_00829]|uniref:anti-sigma factor n=1 Tax=Streptomyces sp. NBC_00829 TaxID=2903679 RepID=UPI00386E6722|nr:anti-sigma factor [Streptomyces sp. NBC_00829]